MDQELIGLNLAVTRRLVQGLQHQAGHHGSGHHPADQAPAIEIIGAAQRTSRCDIARYLQHAVVRMVVMSPAQQRLGATRENPLLQQVFVHSTGSAARVLVRPEDAMVLGLERGIARLMDAWCAVNASVPFTHCLHMGVEDRVLRGRTARVLLSLPPGLGASTGHAQLPAQPGHREMVCRAHLARLLLGSTSLWATTVQLSPSLRQRAPASAFCCDVNRRLVLVGVVIDGQFDGHGVTPIDLSTKRRQPQVFTKQRTSFGGGGGRFRAEVLSPLDKVRNKSDACGAFH
jgi:hypothetical protein